MGLVDVQGMPSMLCTAQALRVAGGGVFISIYGQDSLLALSQARGGKVFLESGSLFSRSRPIGQQKPFVAAQGTIKGVTSR